MIAATYFGEITELGSRAIWYSDEEDEDDSYDEDVKMQASPRQLNPSVDELTHESMRSATSVTLKRLQVQEQNLKINECIISLCSTACFKNIKLTDTSMGLTPLGYMGNSGKVFTFPRGVSNDPELVHSLYIVFDANDKNISGHSVAYFVEALRDELYKELNLDPSSTFVILSRQFSQSDHLEFLSNYSASGSLSGSPFISGKPISAPSLITNHFESALFEQLTLSLKPAYVVCLPDPKNYWFDRTKSWPTVPNEIIDQKLCDDNLEKTLIFT